jgi:beta-xylosidase
VIARRLLAALCSVVIAVGACGGGRSSSSASAGSASPSGAASASGSAGASASAGSSGSAAASAGADQFANPVIARDFPDPFILRDGDTYYAFATTDGAQHLQLARSKDLVTWEELNDPLPKFALWSSGDTWAPEVVKTSAGFVLYYTAHDGELKRPDSNGSQCISVATSAKPEGPYADTTKGPFVCQPELGGSIDATEFEDHDGKRYLIWKNDGNCCGMPTKFYIQPLSADGLKLSGKAVDMGVTNDRPWEGGVIEAPTLLFRDGTYYLFYSANNYDSEFYAIGYATSKKLTGPYTDAPDNPLVASAWDKPITSQARGPGHQSIVADAQGKLWMAFHAFDDDAVGYSNGGVRSMWLAPLTFEGGKPVVKLADVEPKP